MSNYQHLISIASHFQRFLNNMSDINICRLCLQTGISSNFISLHFGNPPIKTKLAAFIPELNIEFIEDPVICLPCSASLEAAFQLKIKGLRTEEKIRSQLQSTAPLRFLTTPIKLSSIFPELIEDMSSNSNSDYIGQYHTSIKHEISHSSKSIFKHTTSNALCGTCKINFSNEQELNTHMQMHVPIRPYTCSICCKTFTLKSNLEIHKRTHTNDRPFICQVCFKRFTTKGNLKIHMRVHTKEKPYICKICDKSFIQKVQLNTHLMLHANKEVFACDTCNKSYSSKGTLQIHKRIHDNIKPYACKYCDKSFTTNGNLVIHVRKHTGETPYKCTECPKAFTQQNQLKTHMNFHRRCIFDS